MRQRLTTMFSGSFSLSRRRLLGPVVLVPLLLLAAQLAGGRPTEASTDRVLPFSASLRSATADVPVPDGTYPVTFRIYQAASGGTALWSETQQVPVGNGLLSTYLGTVTPLPDGLTFADGAYYLGVQVGTDAEMSPRKRIGAVPIALTADTLDGLRAGLAAGNIPTLDSNGNLSLPGGASLGTTLQVSGATTTGSLAVSGTATAASLSVTGTIALGGTLTTKNILPAAASAYDLGSAAAPWSSIYGNTLQTTSLVVSGSASLGATGQNVSFNSSVIPSTSGLNLGSSTNHWASLYVDNLSVGSTDVNGTTSPYFVVGSGSLADANGGLRIYRGPSINSYATLQWDAADTRFNLLSNEGTGTLGTLNAANATLTGLSVAKPSLTSGSLADLEVSGTAALTGQTVLNITTQGANAAAGQTTYGSSVTNAHTGITSTNIAGYYSATGGTNNYGLIVANGSVGIGTATPGSQLQVNGSNDNLAKIIVVHPSSTAYFGTDGFGPYIGTPSGIYGITLNKTSQNVGINAAGVASKFAVSGNMTVGSGYASSVAPANGLSVQGSVSIGTATASAQLTVLATTEQLRLGYDASNYASFTTNGSGNLTVAPSGGTVSVTGTLAASGAFTAAGVNAGSGLLQGAGGLTLTGATSINATGTANTSVGNATGTFQVASSGINVSVTGGLTGVSSIANSGAYVQTGASANTFAGATTFTAAGTALSVTNNAAIGGTLQVSGATTLGNALGVAASTANSLLVANQSGTGAIADFQAAGSSVLTATNSGVTISRPLSLTQAGNFVLGYDLDLTNPTASAVTSQAPLTIQSGDGSGNADLNLTASGAGLVYANNPLQATSTATVAGLLTASNGLTLSAGALNLVATSGTLALSGLASSSLATTGTNALTGAPLNLNASGSGNTSIGNASGSFALASTGLNVTTAGALSGVTTIATSGAINGQTISSAAALTGTLSVATSATTPILYGGANGGSTLTLNGTSSGSPSSAYVLLNPGNGQNVGIGTATPAHTLEVNGTAKVGNLSTTLVKKIADYLLTVSDSVVTADATNASVTLTLPTAVGVSGTEYVLEKVDASANAVTVATTASQTINGAATFALTTQYKYVRLISDGANWLIIGGN